MDVSGGECQSKSILNVHGRNDGEAPILWPPDAKSQLIGHDPDAGKDGRQKEEEEEEVAEDGIVR